MIMQYVVDSVNEICSKANEVDHIFALETGTIRSKKERHYSTKHIADALHLFGTLLSIDRSQNSINIAKEVCKENNNIIWYNEDSITFLQRISSVPFLSFVLLDSKNNPDHILSEFHLVYPLLKTGGILMVDDAGIATNKRGFDSSDARKGHKVWEYLNDNNMDYEVLPVKSHSTQLRMVK